MARDLDMVVDVHATGLPLGEDVARGREGLERRAIEPRIERAAADALLLHRAVVELVEQRPNRGVQRGQAEERLVPEAGEDPPLGHQHTHLRLCLVAGLVGAGRDHDGAVVRGEFLVGAIDTGLIAAGLPDGAFQLVGHPQARRAAKELDHAGVRADPVRQLLGRGRLGVGVAARPEDGDEQLDRPLLAGMPIDDRGPLARVIDEGLRAGPMYPERAGRCPVQVWNPWPERRCDCCGW